LVILNKINTSRKTQTIVNLLIVNDYLVLLKANYFWWRND